MKKLTKIWIILIMLFAGIGTLASHQTSPQFAFASMGSTGGGGSGSTTSTGGGSGSSSTSDDYTSSEFFNLFDLIKTGVIYMVALMLLGMLISAFTNLSFILRKMRLALRLKLQYKSNYLIKLGFSTNKYRTTKSDKAYDLFTPNLKIDHFEKLLRKLRINLKDNNGNFDGNFTEVYKQAQYLYSQLLREKFVNKHYPLWSLKKYLDKLYYKTMVKEIKLKISQAIIDDTVIVDVKVAKYAKLDDSLIVTKLDVTGQDKEVQFNNNFDDSFARNKWSDYVIFAKTRSGNYKIIALVYGEHFHLNGENFNNQKSLLDGKYTVSPQDKYRALNQAKYRAMNQARAKQRKK